MGWETVAAVGFQALQGIQGIKQANSQARGIAHEGEIAAQNSADSTIRAAGKLQTSFLQSGITLEGGPMDVLKSAFGKGYTDIGRIRDNANAGSKNLVSAARTKAIIGLASSSTSAFGSSGGFKDIGNFGDDLGAGTKSLFNGGSFDLGFDASQSFREAGGGFGPGEFK